MSYSFCACEKCSFSYLYNIIVLLVVKSSLSAKVQKKRNHPQNGRFRIFYFWFRIFYPLTVRSLEGLSSLSKQFIHRYLLLHHVIVAVVGNTICCHHDKVKGVLVFRQILVCSEFVL